MNLADLIWTLNGTDSYELAESLSAFGDALQRRRCAAIPGRCRPGRGALYALSG